jgi:hypothetical protein
MFRIIRNFILVLLFITPIVACSQCNVTKGNYSSAGGSEQNTILTIFGNNTFSLQHESWQPGSYENRKTSKMKGRWLCKDNLVTLDLNGEKITAEKITIGKNPLGLDEDTKALHFKTVTKDSFLVNEILYLN